LKSSLGFQEGFDSLDNLLPLILDLFHFFDCLNFLVPSFDVREGIEVSPQSNLTGGFEEEL